MTELEKQLAEARAALDRIKLLLPGASLDKAKDIASEVLAQFDAQAAEQAAGGGEVLPEHETPAMHDAVMAVLYAGVSRSNTDTLWQAYRRALLAAHPAPAAPSDPQPKGVVELAAKAVYQKLPGWCGQPWVEGGNSLKQDEARRYASAALSATEAPAPAESPAAPVHPAGERALPPMPEGWNSSKVVGTVYTADQMRAYARATCAALHEMSESNNKSYATVTVRMGNRVSRQPIREESILYERERGMALAHAAQRCIHAVLGDDSSSAKE